MTLGNGWAAPDFATISNNLRDMRLVENCCARSYHATENEIARVNAFVLAYAVNMWLRIQKRIAKLNFENAN